MALLHSLNIAGLSTPCRLVTAVTLLMVAQAALGHSHHDVINAIQSTADAEGREVLHVVVGGKLMQRSFDRGISWEALGRGLDNRFEFSDLAVAETDASKPVLLASTDGNGLLMVVGTRGAISQHKSGCDLDRGAGAAREGRVSLARPGLQVCLRGCRGWPPVCVGGPRRNVDANW